MATNAKDKSTRQYNGKKSGSKKTRAKRDFKDTVAKEIGTDNFQRPGRSNSFNDPDWYIYDAIMFDGVISMPTLEFKGLKTKWETSRPDVTSKGYLGVPTVSVMYLNPAAGGRAPIWTNNPVNIMARKMYAELSASNAKTSQYAPQDIATLILALGQIIAMTHHARRMYGIFNYYNFYNRAIPKALFGAMGCNSEADYGAMMAQMPNSRAQLNKIIARMDSIHFPNSVNYFRKCEYVYSNLFVDRDDEMPTYLAMMPFSTWTIDETASEEGTVLKTTAVPNANVGDTNPMYKVLNIIEDQLDAVLTSATFNYIFADLINLANRNVIQPDWIHMDMVPVDYTVEPLYSEQFNWQFMNATILGAPKATVSGIEDTPDNDVYPSVRDNCIRYSPTFDGTDFSDIMRMSKAYPVRIPNTDVSDRDFVDLLAYYNIPYVIWKEDDPTSGSEAKVSGISDYYAVCLATFTGDNTRADSADIIWSNGPSYNDDGLIWDLIPDVCKTLNIVHAPLISLPSVAGPVDKSYILSKLGTFVIPNEISMINLRDEVYFGLFKIK